MGCGERPPARQNFYRRPSAPPRGLAERCEPGDGRARPGASVCVWDRVTGRSRRQWPGLGDIVAIEALAFSPDGEAVLTFDRDHVLQAARNCDRAGAGARSAAIQPDQGKGVQLLDHPRGVLPGKSVPGSE